MKNALSIDVEEYFQVHAFSGVIPVEAWGSYPSEVEYNTSRILELLEKYSVTATFFCLGWIAERHRGLIRSIHQRGHEIACHGHLHQLIYSQDPKVFREDVQRAKAVLEDCTGEKVIGYRAPTYSITNSSLWAFDILEELGFLYDSSIFPIYHDYYGIPDSPRFPYRVEGRALVEFPISTLKIGNVNLPMSGGGYFRLVPYALTRYALGRLSDNGEPFVFYIHPWEVNPGTHRVREAPLLSQFRTYVGISRCHARLEKLLGDFPFSSMRQVLKEYGLLD